MHVHDNITQFSIDLINNTCHHLNPRDFVIHTMVFAYYKKKKKTEAK